MAFVSCQRAFMAKDKMAQENDGYLETDSRLEPTEREDKKEESESSSRAKDHQRSRTTFQKPSYIGNDPESGELKTLSSSSGNQYKLVTGYEDGSIVLWNHDEIVKKDAHQDMVLCLSSTFQPNASSSHKKRTGI